MPATIGSAIALELGLEVLGHREEGVVASCSGGASCGLGAVGIAIGDHLVIVVAAQRRSGRKSVPSLVLKAGVNREAG